MPIIDKKLKIFGVDDFLYLVEGNRIFIWGNSARISELLRFIPSTRVTSIFDNNEILWGSYSSDGVLIEKPYILNEDDVIISTVGDPYQDLIFQIEIYSKHFYFYRSEDQIKKYESTELIFLNSSKNKFVISKTDFKILHFIEDEKFIKTVFFMVQQLEDLSDHCFVIYDVNRTNHLDNYKIWQLYIKYDKEYNNILILDGIFNTPNLFSIREKKLVSVIEQCQKIIVHGEYITSSVQNIIRSCIDQFKKKSLLIPWNPNFGRDIRTKLSADTIFKHCACVNIPYFGKDRIKKIMCFFKFDKETRFIQTRISYVMPLNKITIQKKTNKRKKIFIAHSCADYNKIIESLSLLKKYSNEIDIYAIASYGDINYRKKVEQYLQLHKINNFYFINEFLSDQNYSELLGSMDCAVFSMTVGAGMTTLNILFYAGIKVYVPRGSDTYTYLASRGYQCHDTNEIINLSFAEFIKKSEYIENNQKIAKISVSLDCQLKEWNNILNFDSNLISEDRSCDLKSIV